MKLESLSSKYRFIIAGGANTAITFVLYVLLIRVGVNYNLALIITYLIGIVLGFLINRLWTFSVSQEKAGNSDARIGSKSASIQFARYFLVYVLVFAVNFLVLNMLVRMFQFDPVVSQLVAVGLSTIFSYLLQKLWVFNDQSSLGQ